MQLPALKPVHSKLIGFRSNFNGARRPARPVRPFLLAVGLILSGSPTATSAVFGPDDRVALPASHRYLEDRIGILFEARTRTVCTAFCAADDIIATASHCLFRTSGETAPKLSGFAFRTASMPSKAAVRIAGTKGDGAAQNVVSGSVRLSIRPPIEATRDWALVRLASPVCKGRLLTIAPRGVSEIRALAETGRVYQVAYHHDLPGMKLAKGGPCWMRRGETPSDRASVTRDFADTRNLLLHSCDTGAASSGSPLLVDGPGGPEVVGINVGTYVRSKILMQNGDVVHRYKSDTIANTAIGVEAFLPTLAAFSAAEILKGRDQLRILQDLLAREGHYRGPRDGVYGPALRAAIESFEASEQRTQTGMASAALLERLIVLRAAGSTVDEEGASIATGSVKPARRKTK